MSEKCPGCGHDVGPWYGTYCHGCRLPLFAILQRQLARQQAEIERLKAIVDKLPKTADGVAVVPGMDIFSYGAPDRRGGVDLIVARYGALSVFGSPFYTTREAAVAAQAAAEAAAEAAGKD